MHLEVRRLLPPRAPQPEKMCCVIKSTHGQNEARAVSGYGYREFGSSVADLQLVAI
jgi:hypothetical protein